MQRKRRAQPCAIRTWNSHSGVSVNRGLGLWHNIHPAEVVRHDHKVADDGGGLGVGVAVPAHQAVFVHAVASIIILPAPCGTEAPE